MYVWVLYSNRCILVVTVVAFCSWFWQCFISCMFSSYSNRGQSCVVQLLFAYLISSMSSHQVCGLRPWHFNHATCLWLLSWLPSCMRSNFPLVMDQHGPRLSTPMDYLSVTWIPLVLFVMLETSKCNSAFLTPVAVQSGIPIFCFCLSLFWSIISMCVSVSGCVHLWRRHLEFHSWLCIRICRRKVW